MSKLVLKFESSILKEVAVGQKEVSIGRSPDNGIVIDNPAVSSYHARVFNEEGRLMLAGFRQPQRHVRQRPARQNGDAQAGRFRRHRQAHHRRH